MYAREDLKSRSPLRICIGDHHLAKNMNFSSIRNIYLDFSLRVLGHREPFDDLCVSLSPRDKLPCVTNKDVSKRLEVLPDLEELHSLQTRQMQVRPQTYVNQKLKLFCRCAGRHQIRALGILKQLAYGLASLDHEGLAQPFVSYEHLIQAAIATKDAHAAWELSIDERAFFKKNPHPRAVRHEYLSYLLRVVHFISTMAFPEDYQDSYVRLLGDFLARDDWKRQLIMDSEETYELSKKRTRQAKPGVIAPPQRYPVRFKLHGQTRLSPYLVYSTGLYGQQLVPNARCVREGA